MSLSKLETQILWSNVQNGSRVSGLLFYRTSIRSERERRTFNIQVICLHIKPNRHFRVYGTTRSGTQQVFFRLLIFDLDNICRIFAIMFRYPAVISSVMWTWNIYLLDSHISKFECAGEDSQFVQRRGDRNSVIWSCIFEEFLFNYTEYCFGLAFATWNIKFKFIC